MSRSIETCFRKEGMQMKEDFIEFMNPPVDTGSDPGPDMQIVDVGLRLRELRKKSSLSGRSVCQRLKETYDIEVQENTLVAYESEKRVPNVKVFLALCDLYQCADVMEYFCGRTVEKTSISLENFDAKGMANILVQHYGEKGIKEIIECLLGYMKLDINS